MRTEILNIESVKKLAPNGPYASSYNGVIVQQRPDAVLFLINFINANNITHIVEVGTGYGGLTCALLDHTCSSIISIDIKDKANHLRTHSRNNFTQIIADCQSSRTLEEINKYVVDVKPGNTLFLIDGGYKMQEFNIYSKFLKYGDYIFVHDFAPNKDAFEYLKTNNIWLWHESNESKLNLEGLERLLFFDSNWKKYIWGTYQKTSN
jgi:hypothetical protein